jgi:hypothetical protein
MNEIQTIEVQNIVHLKTFVQTYVQQLISIRKNAGFSQ